MGRLRPYSPKRHGVPRVDDQRVLSDIILLNFNGLRCIKTTIHTKCSTAVGSDGAIWVYLLGS